MCTHDSIKIGETVVITNPKSGRFDQFGEFVGMADTFDGLQPKYRIRFGDDIGPFYRDEFMIA